MVWINTQDIVKSLRRKLKSKGEFRTMYRIMYLIEKCVDKHSFHLRELPHFSN